MLNAIFRPLEKWPTKPTTPKSKSAFQATYTQTLDVLEGELRRLQAQNIVIQAFFTRAQLGNNQWPKGGQNPSEPGVILTFTRHGDAYSYPCDTFNWWTANLRAIALALEALRKVDRYGVTASGQQYAGFKQIPAASPVRAGMTPGQAAEFISKIFPFVTADAILAVKRVFEAALTEAQAITHPDKGGSHEDFVKLQQAAEVLIAHHNAKGKGA